MSTVFADTAYYVAVLLESDALHARAVAIDEATATLRSVTTDAVLVEVLAYFSKRGRHARLAAVELIDALRTDPRYHHPSVGRALLRWRRSLSRAARPRLQPDRLHVDGRLPRAGDHRRPYA